MYVGRKAPCTICVPSSINQSAPTLERKSPTPISHNTNRSTGRLGHLPLQSQPHSLEPEPKQRPLTVHRFARLSCRRFGRVTPLPSLYRLMMSCPKNHLLRQCLLHRRKALVRLLPPCCQETARSLTRGVAPRSLPFPLFRRPALLFFLLLPSSRFLFLRTRFRLLILEIFGGFSLVEFLALDVHDCFLGCWVDNDVSRVRATAEAEGAFE